MQKASKDGGGPASCIPPAPSFPPFVTSADMTYVRGEEEEVMDPMIRTNTKARVNLACPRCGMNLKKAPQGGFVQYGETYCCRGCADGSGCSCYAGTEVRKSFSRPGDAGWRNSENTPRDRNDNKEVDTSSRPLGKRKAEIPPRYKSRDQRQWEPRSKRLKTQNKPKDSTREQARGRSEQRGRLGRPARSENQDRISRTGSKGK